MTGRVGVRCFGVRCFGVAAAVLAVIGSAAGTSAAPPCLSIKDTPQLPADKALCRSLEREVRRPSALPLDRYEDKLGTYVRNFLPPRSGEWLEGRQAHPRHRPLCRDIRQWRLERPRVRHPSGGARVVLAGHVRVAQGQSSRTAGPAGAAHRGSAGAGWRDHHQGDVFAAGGSLRRRRLHPLAARPGRRADGARPQGLLRRLVLGLVRLVGVEARLAGDAGQRLSQHGLRPVLHELPRVGEGEPDLRVAAQHQGRAGRAFGVPEPGFLPRPVMAQPSRRRCRGRRDVGAGRAP